MLTTLTMVPTSVTFSFQPRASSAARLSTVVTRNSCAKPANVSTSTVRLNAPSSRVCQRVARLAFTCCVTGEVSSAPWWMATVMAAAATMVRATSTRSHG